MSNFEDPVLVFGDYYLSKNTIVSFKKKLPKTINVITVSASEYTYDKIDSVINTCSFDDCQKVVIIEDIPNKKQVRDDLIKFSNACIKDVKIILWDSNGYIKLDEKTRSYGKMWGDFVQSFRNIKNAKIINNGNEFNEKSESEAVQLVISEFREKNIEISVSNAKLLCNIVGLDRGLLISEIEKLLLVAPKIIDEHFIIEHVYPSNYDSVLYKFSNILDTSSYSDAILTAEKFVNDGINHNVLADLMVRRSRWQLVVTYYYKNGLSWDEISDALMSMGRTPSSIWHSNISNKKKESDKVINLRDFLSSQNHYPFKHFKPLIDTDKQPKPETISYKFMADQVVNYIRNEVVYYNRKEKDVASKLYKKAVNIYLVLQHKLANVRYGNNPDQELVEMIRIATNMKDLK